MASPLQLYSFIQGEYEDGRKQHDTNRLRSLYQQALAAPAQNQRAIIGQVAGIDPAQAKGLYDLLNSRAEDQRKSVGQRAAMVRALPQEQRQAAYEGIRPELDEAGLFAPEGADEGYLGAVAQTYGGLGSGASGVQSTYVDAAGNRVAIMRDGSTRTLGANDAGMSQQTIEVQGPDGRPMRYTFDKRTGNYIPMGAGQAMAAQPRAAGEVPFAIDPSLPPDIQASIRSDESRWATMPEINIGPAGGIPVGIGQSPAEKAYAEQIAKTQAELDAGGAVTRLEADRAAAKARAEAAAKAQAEVDAKAATRTRDADQTLALLDEAERILPQATGSRAGSVRDSLAGMAGIATEGAKASDSLKIIAAELVAKVPRFEGPQSNIDVQFYREAAGDLANDQLPVERRMAALQTIRRLRQKYASAQPAKRSYTQQEALQKLQDARRAIGSGADREAVRQRLRDLGLNNIAERL